MQAQIGIHSGVSDSVRAFLINLIMINYMIVLLLGQRCSTIESHRNNQKKAEHMPRLLNMIAN